MSGRRQSNEQQMLEERLVEQARLLRAQANRLPPGAPREELIRRARLDEAAAHMSGWLNSPLRAPT